MGLNFSINTLHFSRSQCTCRALSHLGLSTMALWYYGSMILYKNGMKIAPTMSMKTRMKKMMKAIPMETISMMIMWV